MVERVRIRRHNRSKRELYDVEAAPLAPKVRMLKAEVVEALSAVRVCDMDFLGGRKYFDELRTAHHDLFSYGPLGSSSADNAPTTSSRTPRPSKRHNERGGR